MYDDSSSLLGAIQQGNLTKGFETVESSSGVSLLTELD
jgi:hypothetical protein